MKTINFFSDKIILICSICAVASFLGQIFISSTFVNAIYAISLIMILVCYFLNVDISREMIVIPFLMVISVITRELVTNNSDFFTHVLITYASFICVELAYKVKMNFATYKKIFYIFFATSLILVVAYHFGSLKSSYFKHTDAIALNFPNPNAAALWVAALFIILVSFSLNQKKILRIVLWIIAAAMLPIVSATESRNSYFACIFFVAGILLIKVLRIKKLPNWLLLILSYLPIIVFFFYMFVVMENKAFWEEFFQMDKNIDTRANIWRTVLDDFQNCLFLGNYYRFYDSQMHNSLMTIFVRFGAPTTILAANIIYRSLKNLQNTYSPLAALSLASIMITGCFEASIFVGVAGLFLTPLIVASCYAVNESEEKSPDEVPEKTLGTA